MFEQENLKFELSVQTVGTIGGIHPTSDGFGFSVSEGQPIAASYYDEGRFNVYFWNGRVYISTSLLTILVGTDARWYMHQAHIGRKYLFAIDCTEICDNIERHFQFKRRNANEVDVSRRNESIYMWLLELATTGVVPEDQQTIEVEPVS